MKKSLLWVLMLALSFVVIPSCGDEEEGTKEETVTSSYEQWRFNFCRNCNR